MERRGSKIGKVISHQSKVKFGEQSWLTEQEDLRVEGEMTGSLFRIQHPLTPHLSALSSGCTGAVLVVRGSRVRAIKAGIGLSDRERAAGALFNELFAVAENSVQLSARVAFSGISLTCPNLLYPRAPSASALAA